MGKGSKGGYYSSGGSSDCDCNLCDYPGSMCCNTLNVGWFIYVLVLAFNLVPGGRLDERPILHSGEMRPFELAAKNAYGLSTTQFTDQLGLIDLYRINTLPPLLTASTAAAQNKSARIDVFPIRDTYDFPDQYDWWYQNAWMTTGSRVLLQASCNGQASLNIVRGDDNFSKWKKAANGEEGDTSDYQYTSRPTTNGEGTLTYTHTDPSNEIYFTVVKSSTSTGDTIDCAMTVNLTFVSYDLSGLTNRIRPSRETREFEYNDGAYLLMVCPVPTGGRAWYDIGTHFKQDIPAVLEVGPLMGIMFAGIVFLTAVGCIIDCTCRKGCEKTLSCQPDWGFCSCDMWDCECRCKCAEFCTCPDCDICSKSPEPAPAARPIELAAVTPAPKASTPPPAEAPTPIAVKVDPTAGQTPTNPDPVTVVVAPAAAAAAPEASAPAAAPVDGAALAAAFASVDGNSAAIGDRNAPPSS